MKYLIVIDYHLRAMMNLAIKTDLDLGMCISVIFIKPSLGNWHCTIFTGIAVPPVYGTYGL